jgi:hypothetical protein
MLGSMSLAGRWSLLVAAVIPLVAAACGGKVYLDRNGAGADGSGGSGAAGNSGGFGGATPPPPPNGGGGPGCVEWPTAAELTFCGGSVGAGGGTFQCENDFCDQQGGIWSALCDKDSCQCLVNGSVECTCALVGAGDFCGGTPSCCPLPDL